MKKHIILLGFLAVGFASAQTGKVGVNTSNPRATLDINPSTANAAAAATTNEGVLVPRLSKSRLNSIAVANLTEATLVYVDNIAGTSMTVTSNVTSKGFYYYSTTESKWVKIAEGTIQEQDLRLVGTNSHITQDAGVGGNGSGVGTGPHNIAIGKDAMYSNTSGSHNISLGLEALRSNTTGVNNVAVGIRALHSNGTGTGNIGIGANSLYSNAGGIYNVAVGENALYSTVSGVGNVAVGTDALYRNTTGGRNTAMGFSALYNNTTGNGNIANGLEALYSNTVGNFNLAMGHQALYSNTSGSSNVAFGTEALRANTTGESNIALGISSLTANTTGNFNVGIGQKSLTSNTGGESNIGIGSQALQSNTMGSYNVGLGFDALRYNTTGSSNVGLGLYALSANTTGNSNVGLGNSTLSNNTTGSHNIGLGTTTLNKNSTGSYNVGIGNSALMNNGAGMGNVAIGNQSMVSNNGGNYNVAVGYESLRLNTTGRYNIALGANTLANTTTGQHNNAQGLNALQNNTTGSNNIALGNASGNWIRGNSNIHLGSSNFQSVSTSELDNVIVIGNGINSSELTATTGQDNTIILGYKKGHSFSPNVGVGTYKPDSKLHIETNNGNAIKIVDGNQGAGRVLTSDANGVGTWQVPAYPVAEIARFYARTNVNVTLPVAQAIDVPGVGPYTIPKTGKYMIMYSAFLPYTSTGTKRLYFVTLTNGVPVVDADEIYQWGYGPGGPTGRDVFTGRFHYLASFNQGDVVTFKLNANVGGLLMDSAYASRNRIELIYLGQ